MNRGFYDRQKLHHVFHDSAVIAFTGYQNAENELIQRYVPLNRGKISFSILKNEENLLKLSEVPLNSGLHDSAKIAFSCPRMKKMSLHENMYP